MSLSDELLKVLVCPRCRSSVSLDLEQDGLLCSKCQLLFPIQNNIPIMLEDEAQPMGPGGPIMSKGGKRIAIFEISEGKNKSQVVKLPLGTCKAIGRSLEDATKTQVFSMDFTMSLDEMTKKLVMNYIAKKSPGTKAASSVDAGDTIGSFKRLPDLVLDDPAISRLHAMLFHDANGAGLLDLVSRNGTYVNGEEVESKNLEEGDLIEIGGTKMVFGYK